MGKVIDLSVRRKHTPGSDPIVDLADEVLKLIVQSKLEPAQQIAAVDLVGSAIAEAVKHARGLIELNKMLIEAQHLRRRYELAWPDQDQSPTVYDPDE